MPTSVSEPRAVQAVTEPPVLEVHGLVAGYGRATVLRDVTLEVPAHGFVSILGANGAGKSTLLKAVVGAARVTAGRITVQQQDVTHRPTYRTTRGTVAVVPEGRALVPDLSVRDNLLLGVGVWSRRARGPEVDAALDDCFALFPRLAERRDQKAGSMSGGEQQMLAIGRAMVAKPQLLVLDEPSLGLAPQLIAKVFDALAELHRRGMAVLLAEQNVAAATRVTTTSYVLSGGAVVAHGPSHEIANSDRLRAAFLGQKRDSQ